MFMHMYRAELFEQLASAKVLDCNTYKFAHCIEFLDHFIQTPLTENLCSYAQVGEKDNHSHNCGLISTIKRQKPDIETASILQY